MQFKRAKVFKLSADDEYNFDDLEAQLEKLEFKPCLPITYGWVAPAPHEEDEETIFVYESGDNYALLCMQIEKKVLPAAVVRQKLVERIEYRERRHNRPKTTTFSYLHD